MFNALKKRLSSMAGVKNMKKLLIYILDNYATEEYFDPDLIEEFTNAKAE